MYHISVDASRCQGHARCLAFAPDIFEFDQEGYAYVPEDKADQAQISPQLQLAITNCPERSILVKDDQEK